MIRTLTDMALVSGAMQTSWAAVAEQQWMLFSLALGLVCYGCAGVAAEVRRQLTPAACEPR